MLKRSRSRPFLWLTAWMSAVVLLVVPALATSSQAVGLDPTAIASGTYTYLTTITVGDNSMEIPSSRNIRADSIDDQTTLRIETSSTTGMGVTTDVLHIDSASLFPIERDIVQGDGRLQLAYTTETVSGLIRAAGQIIPVDVVLEEPAYAGDAGLDTLLAALPLRAGLVGELQIIETDVEVYVQRFGFRVDPLETIEVEAGTFESWPVHLQASDDPDYRQTVWITDSRPRFLVRAEAPVPEDAGGGTLITSLIARQTH